MDREAEVIWLDALIAGSGGNNKGRAAGGGCSRDVGQNVKLELIRAHCGGK